MTNPFLELEALGQSIWLDDIDREEGVQKFIASFDKLVQCIEENRYAIGGGRRHRDGRCGTGEFSGRDVRIGDEVVCSRPRTWLNPYRTARVLPDHEHCTK